MGNFIHTMCGVEMEGHEGGARCPKCGKEFNFNSAKAPIPKIVLPATNTIQEALTAARELYESIDSPMLPDSVSMKRSIDVQKWQRLGAALSQVKGE